MPDPTIRPIATILLRRLFLGATVCSLLFMATQSVYSYLHVKEEFQAELKKIAITNVPLLAINLWDIEPDAVRRQIDNIATRPQIGYVHLTVVTGQSFSAGDQSLAGKTAAQNFDIRSPNNAAGPLANLAIYENPAAFYHELAMSVGIAALGYLSLTVLICALSVYVLKRELERPLRRIAQFVTQLTPHTLMTPLALERPAGRVRDEIDLVVAGFQVLQSEISGHIHNLDQLVMQRTQDLQSALGAIQRLSLLDPLTQCLNRRAFDAQIAQEMERAQRYGRPFSLAFGDIDHFKRINDSLGHLVGDQVLQAVAQCLRDGLRTDIDWLVRFGGEEFVVLMPETALAGAIASVERLRKALEVATILPEQASFRVTISFGVAEYRPGEAVDGLVLRADSLLYQAKQAGRNQTWPRPHCHVC